MRGYSDDVLLKLDLALCKLDSLGRILTQLATDEGQEPDLASFADLGRVIEGQAASGLELIGDGEDIPGLNPDDEQREHVA